MRDRPSASHAVTPGARDAAAAYESPSGSVPAPTATRCAATADASRTDGCRRRSALCSSMLRVAHRCYSHGAAHAPGSIGALPGRAAA